MTDQPVSELVDLYLRRSSLREDKATLDEHERILRAAVALRGLTVRKVWREERSASKRGVKRDKFDSAIAAVLAQETGGLWVFKLDRLSRRGMGHVGIVLDDFERIGAALVAHMDGLDSKIEAHRTVFAITAERARSEAKDIGLRTKIGKDAHRPLGHWPGGPAPYGLKSLRLYPDDPMRRSAVLDKHPTEYKTARAMAVMLLDDETALAVAEWLNEQGHTTRRGKRWRASTVATWARTPGVAGLMHRKERIEDPETGREWWRPTGEAVMGADGKPIRVGEGVVTPDERLQIIAALDKRGRDLPVGFTNRGFRGKRRGTRQAQSLLTGIMRCFHCLTTMARAGKQYRCQLRAESGVAACRGMFIDAAKADAEVSERWLHYVSVLDPSDDEDSARLSAIAREWYGHQDPGKALRLKEVRVGIDAITDRRNKLDTAYYVSDDFKDEGGEERYRSLKSAITSQLEGLRAELRELTGDIKVSDLLEPEELTAAWADSDLDTRRTLLKTTVKQLVGVPAKYRGDRTPMRERIKLEWK
ncbi:recombinase family protein [Streptomyces scopuliridis]|uniref:recombinase family protein n=1 Tax=Streptomyces scopuliridis TaxID=452529 RepID=UPI0036B8E904